MSFIKPQINDNIITSLRNIILKMQKANRLFYIGELTKESWEIEKEDFHKSLAEIIKDRFGIRIKPKDAGFFAIYPIFDIDKIENLNQLEKGAKKNAKKGITEATMSTDVKKAIKNAREFKKWLDKGTVVIDTENAYIEKIPASIVITMYTSIKDIGFGKTDELTADELVAVILHEIGHVFNSLESYVNVHHTTQGLLDAFLENNFGYIKELGITTDPNDPYVINNKNKKDVIVKLYQELDNKVSKILLGQAGINEINTEFEADAFVVRFGIADKLTSALVKLKGTKTYQFRFLPIMIAVSMIKFMLTSLISILVFLFTGSLALFITVGLTLYMATLTAKFLFLIALNVYTRLPNLDEHGTMITRLENIKTQTLQMLRRTDIKQKDKEKLVTVIENIDSDLELTDKSMSDSILATIFDIYSAPNMSVEETLTRLIDKIVNNGFWIHTVKFRKVLRTIGQESYVGDYNRLMATSVQELLVGEEDSIQYQGSKDPIVTDLINFFKKVTDNSIVKNITDYFKLAEELSTKIEKRFGLKVYVIPAYGTSGGFASLPFRISNNHPFYSDRSIFKYSLPLSLGGMIGYISYTKDMSLLERIESGKADIEVDLKKAYIKGLDGYANFLFIEFGRDIFTGLFTHKTTKNLALTPEELTAVTLHEIGHLFTYLKELKASVVSTTILRDRFLTLKEDIDKIKITGKDFSIKETYQDMTGFFSVVKNLISQYSYVVLMQLLSIPNSILKGKISQKVAEGYAAQNNISILGNIRESMTMSETEADNFAAMFGLTKQLTTGLEKYLRVKSKSYLKQILSINIFIIISLLLKSLGKLSLPTILMVLVLETLIRAAFSFFTIIFGDYFPYEKFPNRIKRMKQDLIKVLRTENVSSDLQAEIVDQIDFLYEEVKLLEDSAAGSILANIFSFNPSYGKDVTITQRKIDMLVDLIENDQYYFSKKFEQIIKNM